MNQEHWDKIFQSTEQSKLGWYEQDVEQTLKFLSLVDEKENSTYFIPGAGTSILVDKLISNKRHLILNDISETALNILSKKHINHSDSFTIFQHNLSEPFANDFEKIDVWIDRAVLHFLLKESQIKTYFENLKLSTHSGSYVLFAEFSPNGAPKCAGLPLHRYSLDELKDRLGGGFEMIKGEDYTFVNPRGEDRPYVYGLFKRL